MPGIVSVFWFRRDLRLNDNAGFYQALKSGIPVVPLFIFDSVILDALEDKHDRRVCFIYDTLKNMQDTLAQSGRSLDVRYGEPLAVFNDVLRDYAVQQVFTNEDYEPYAKERDASVSAFLKSNGIPLFSIKDQVIFAKEEIVKDNGEPYAIYTPFAKRWRGSLNEQHLKAYNSEALLGSILQQNRKMPKLAEIGFKKIDVAIDPEIPKDIIRHYDETRDLPATTGTTRLGVHLRFGTVSIRHLVKVASEMNSVFLGELIWREFFMQMLWQEPRLVNESYRREYDRIKWRNSEKEFQKWCEGQTGFPIVDAGMRELNETGFMHNRVRMITASFLVKDLLIDWRWGEAYFAQKLNDYELSSNNGNWQWAAGCGCDAAPYFRVFNPETQQQKFDPQMRYVKKWVQEYGSSSYPAQMVDHAAARERCLTVFKTALRK